MRMQRAKELTRKCFYKETQVFFLTQEKNCSKINFAVRRLTAKLCV